MATQDHWIPIHGNPSELAAASPPKADSPPIYQFGDFSLDVGRAELRRSGGRVDIQPLVLDLLTYLIANRGRVASKEELFLNVWGGIGCLTAPIWAQLHREIVAGDLSRGRSEFA